MLSEVDDIVPCLLDKVCGFGDSWVTMCWIVVVFDFDLILTLIWLLSHAELLEGFLSLVDLTRGPHVFTVHPVVCSVRTVGKPQTL